MKLILFLITLIGTRQLSAQGIAVVELFTSQGCSSCPAADQNLTDIIQKAEKEGLAVYGLSFHVDYWNYIGWKDPYSQKEFTGRQQKYAENLSLGSIYTPQMIVNGQTEFVGSNKEGSEKAIATALKQIPHFQISISSVTVADGQVRVHYAVDKLPAHEIMNIAVVEKDVTNFVPSGENKGRKLHHDNVVRAFNASPLQHDGELELRIPAINSAKASVILFVQNQQWRVVGASIKPLPKR